MADWATMTKGRSARLTVGAFVAAFAMLVGSGAAYAANGQIPAAIYHAWSNPSGTIIQCGIYYGSVSQGGPFSNVYGQSNALAKKDIYCANFLNVNGGYLLTQDGVFNDDTASYCIVPTTYTANGNNTALAQQNSTAPLGVPNCWVGSHVSATLTDYWYLGLTWYHTYVIADSEFTLS